jgi:GT2 family glycosyltransferase
MGTPAERAVSGVDRAPVSVVIATYRREQVLLDTVERLLRARARAREILVVDQTESHAAETADRLRALDGRGEIRWERLDRPLIPHAMNTGLALAREPVVLFLDDDIVPDEGLVAAHARAHAEAVVGAVAGRVVQPWESDAGDEPGEFRFSSRRRQWVSEFMGGNFSVKRSLALGIGGFDENFVRAAYRFEADFADRLLAAGGRILFEPSASIRHLMASEGGVRAFGRHLRTARPGHAVGEYYYLLRHWKAGESVRRLLWRPIRAVRTRHHLRRPWWIPVTLTAEVLGLCWGAGLALRGPRYLGARAKVG